MNTKLLMSVLIACLVSAVCFTSRRAAAYPEPSAAVRSWQLDFTHSKPRAISVRTAQGVRWYWYMTYKVVNNSGQERVFVPEVVIATDQGDIVEAGKGVPASVFPAVKQQANIRLLESPIEVMGQILQGEDNARESVAIWPAFPHNVDEVRIFFTGLSGETQVIPEIKDPKTGEPVSVRKTLMITYTLPGTGESPQNQPILGGDEQWIMR
jgi:hypothetical protein